MVGVDWESRSEVQRKRRRAAAPIGVAIVVVILAVVIVARGLAPSHALQYGDALGTHGSVGQAMFIGMGTSSRNIVVRHAEPVLGAGSAPAAISVLICHSVSPNEILGEVKDVPSLDALCSSVVPAAGARVGRQRHDGNFDYFFMSVVPLAPGSIVVDGVRVTHSSGWHDTTERTGMRVTISTDPV